MRAIKYIKIWDWLLIAAAILAPMTSLRFGSKVGPGELAIFIWSLGVINYRSIKITYLERFFIGFLFSILIGSLCGLLIAPDELSRVGWRTWVYFALISHALLCYLNRNSKEYIARLFNVICILSTLVQFFLYEYSVNVSRSLMGLQIWYSSRYSGGGSNPHQVALPLCAFVFWFVYKVLKEKKILYAPLAYISFFLMNKTQSSTGEASVYLSFLVLFVIWVLRLQQSRSRKIMFLLIGAVVTAGLIYIFRNKLYTLAYDWISADKNGWGRFRLWSELGRTFKKSPFFGLGVGCHTYLTTSTRMGEFHNSYFDILAATGLFGFFIFGLFTYRLVAKILKNEPMLLPIILVLYGYSMAGFAARRLPYWIITVFILAIVEHSEPEYMRIPERRRQWLYE